MSKYDWKRRTELLMQEVGRFLAYTMSTNGTTSASIRTVRRGVKLRLDWRSNSRQQWTTFHISCPNGRDAWLELKHNHKLIVTDWTRHKDDWKKLYKQLERTISTHLVDEWSLEILQSADDNYHWGNTCTVI